MARKAEARPGTIPALQGNQRLASAPEELVWLSASAGTGKTQVLSARVLRLLLRGVAPEAILCLTFTKAGATEMARRVNRQLAHWVMADEAVLFHDLEALGADSGPEARQQARTLFARLLDARGGLRIQTIHSFCQSLLAAFPLEADLPPGFALMDDREAALLARRSFAELMAEAEHQENGLIPKLAGKLGIRLGEAGAMAYLQSLAPLADALAQLPASLEGMTRWMHRSFSGGTSDIRADLILPQLADPVPDLLHEYLAGLQAWGSPKDSVARIARIKPWLLADVPGRLANFGDLVRGWLTAAGSTYAYTAKTSSHLAPLAAALKDWSDPISDLITLAEQADLAAEAVLIGRAYALRHAQAKRDAGLVGYDDLIMRTSRLLAQPGMGDWVRFQLDQATDHILIDEAQDTNLPQWTIVKALADDFFSGAGAKGNRLRTLFTVGDFKQAIFGFQGTDPENFRTAQRWFAERAAEVGRELLDLSLSQSFRSAQPILDAADAVIKAHGFEALGMDAPVDAHVSANASWPGSVMLTAPIMAKEDATDEDSSEEEWIGEADRKLANLIADQIFHWWKVEPLWIARHHRYFRPGDVMILLRARKQMPRLIVARLHEKGVPVAGLDRLRLSAPLAVQDLLSCARFAMQPEDDLNLAGLLVSPLIGLSQDQLYEAAKGRGERRLWPHLDETLRAQLLPILNAADMISPARFFETILSGAMQGRTRLLSRLGEEARDPINALMDAALEFEALHPPSLQLFLDWFDKSDTEIKRDAEAGDGLVRVMTAHGAKGLQAPIVILADATRDPSRAKADALPIPLEDGVSLPLPRPRKESLRSSLRTQDVKRIKRDLEENRRLLYVALTRAEERLIVTGALNKGDVPELSWHADVSAAMDILGAETQESSVWDGPVRIYGSAHWPEPKGVEDAAPSSPVDLPEWLHTPPGKEATPARPLAPSSLGKDDAVDPPASPAMAEAAQRGIRLHALFERLPPLPPEARMPAALAWLENGAGVADPSERQGLAETALGIIAEPAFADWFHPDALAEAPLAGVVDGFVVAGTVDRLRVTETHVKLIDFKTGRFVPRSAEAAPVSHVRQMAAYARLLAEIFPGRTVEAALLYTSGPRVITLPPALLERHKPDLAWQQEVLPQAG